MRIFLKYLMPVVFFTITVVLVFLSNTSSPTCSLNNKLKNTIAYILPQNWSFFTISAKENSLELYKINSNQTITKFNYQNGSSGSFLGFDRCYRSIGVLIYSISKEVQDSLWSYNTSSHKKKIDSINILNLSKSDYFFLMENESYLLVSKPKLPWIWCKNDSISVSLKQIIIKPI